jgi:hypothetical protein
MERHRTQWPLIEDLQAYIREQAVKLSRGHDLAKAFNYLLKRWASSLRMGACAVSLRRRPPCSVTGLRRTMWL